MYCIWWPAGVGATLFLVRDLHTVLTRAGVLRLSAPRSTAVKMNGGPPFKPQLNKVGYILDTNESWYASQTSHCFKMHYRSGDREAATAVGQYALAHDRRDEALHWLRKSADSHQFALKEQLALSPLLDGERRMPRISTCRGQPYPDRYN